MLSLRVDGTVLVEAALDVTGHVEPGSARIVQSPNHAFDEEALRVVRGSVYRPARSESRAVPAGSPLPAPSLSATGIPSPYRIRFVATPATTPPAVPIPTRSSG